MNQYKYALIDANFILKRNCEAVFRGLQGGISKDDIIKSFNQSVNKLQREIGFNHGLLLFDKFPYYKSAFLPEYKGDRVYINEEYLENYMKENPNPDPMELYNIQNQVTKNRECIRAKYEIINTRRFDRTPVIKKGFEADDLAYILACKLRDKPYRSILIATDSDWLTFTNPQVDYISMKKDRETGEYITKAKTINTLKLISNALKIQLYDIGILNELFLESHNNIQTYRDKHPEVKYRDFCEAMYNSEDKVPDYTEYKSYYDGMYMRSHANEIEVKLE